MSDEPIAQGIPAPQALDSQTPAAAPPAQDHSGTQRRIDELVAQRAAAERTAQEALQALSRHVQEQAARAQAVPAQPEVDLTKAFESTVDPNVIAMTKQLLAAQAAQLKAQQQAELQRIEAQYGAQSVAQQAASLKGIPQEVGQRAAQLFHEAKMRGSQATQEEALRFAIGDWFIKQQGQVSQVHGHTGRDFSPASQVVTAPNPLPLPARSRAAPANFESLSLDEQLAHMERDFGNESLD